MSRHRLLRDYKHALLRVADPVASRRAGSWSRCATTARRRSSSSAGGSAGTPRPGTVLAALGMLQAAGLAAEDQAGRWVARDPPSRDDLLGQLRLRGPHDLRHTFAAWLEDAGIRSALTRWQPDRHALGLDGPELEARVVTAIEQRLAVSFAVAAHLVSGDPSGSPLGPAGAVPCRPLPGGTPQPSCLRRRSTIRATTVASSGGGAVVLLFARRRPTPPGAARSVAWHLTNPAEDPDGDFAADDRRVLQVPGQLATGSSIRWTQWARQAGASNGSP
jgi:hypothetical protein